MISGASNARLAVLESVKNVQHPYYQLVKRTPQEYQNPLLFGSLVVPILLQLKEETPSSELLTIRVLGYFSQMPSITFPSKR
jgi:hypothetical protein